MPQYTAEEKAMLRYTTAEEEAMPRHITEEAWPLMRQSVRWIICVRFTRLKQTKLRCYLSYLLRRPGVSSLPPQSARHTSPGNRPDSGPSPATRIPPRRRKAAQTPLPGRRQCQPAAVTTAARFPRRLHENKNPPRSPPEQNPPSSPSEEAPSEYMCSCPAPTRQAA